jgi:predicted transposase YbfD/YdcC
MATKIAQSKFMQVFSILPDPRKPRNQLHSLPDIISTAILAILCGYGDWEDVNLWTEGHLPWLQSLGICLEGAPSHDTYNRFFRFLDPTAMEQCFIQWTRNLVGKIQGIVAIDGKTLRGSAEASSDLDAIHMVSAFASQNEVILGQLKTAGKGKELAGIKLMLELLDIEGATVTIDAGGCHKEVAELVRAKKADYILGLKGNQGILLAETENFFAQVLLMQNDEWESECHCDYFISEEKSRNRLEKREVWATSDLDWLPQRTAWKDLTSVVCIRSTRMINKESSIELRFYISSRDPDAALLGKGIREHWGIENKVHHVLDVAYNEDNCRVRKDHGAENLSVLRRATQNMMKLEKSKKLSINKKRTLAAVNPEYRLKLLCVAAAI